jgi:hypothetical protein
MNQNTGHVGANVPGQTSGLEIASLQVEALHVLREYV